MESQKPRDSAHPAPKAPKRTSKDYLMLALKGGGMGAADIVPGVSGGTVAFITGIYEELLGSIKSVNLQALKMLFSDGIAATWQHINGNFLVVLFGGILFSIFSLAQGISYLLSAYPELVWSFFFGLIVASVWHVIRQIKRWQLDSAVALVLGAVVAFWITELSPTEIEVTPLTLFFSGALAICAMVLPGISGSFILLIIGMYANVIAAVKGLEFGTLLIFAAGCLCGLLSIANLLSWMFTRFHSVTLALLTGFMIGALNKVWPWKETLQFRLNSHGESVPFLQQNVLPGTYETVMQAPSHLPAAILCMFAGLGIVLLLEYFGTKEG